MRRTIAIGAAIAASALLLTACSSSGDDPSPSSTPSDDGMIDGSGATLTVWVDENRLPAVEAAATQFETDTGAVVELVQKNFEDMRADFIAQVPTGEGPDITVGAHDWTGALVTAGVVDTIDLGDKAGEFEQVALDALSYDGQLYGLPYALETIALIQNNDLVGETPPATWDEMIQMGLDSGADRPFVINTNGETGDGYTMYGFQTSFGAPVFVQDASGSYTSEVGMGGEAGEAFAQWLYDNGAEGTGYISTTVDYDINNELFNSGAAPFTIQGPWAIGSFPDVNLSVHPIPTAGPEAASPFVGVQGFFLSSQSANALLAQEFLVNYIATEDAQRALYEADPRIPAWSTVAQEAAADPVTAGFLASAQTGVPMPSIPEMGSVWDFWNAAQVQIINGADATGTWDTMVTDLTAAIS